MKKAAAITAIMLLAGCCSHKSVVTATETRRADTLSTLSAVKASTIDRETVTERLVMKADSSGVLRVVSRDVTRVTDHGRATVTDTASRSTAASLEAETRETETVVDAKQRAWPWVATVWIMMLLLVSACAFVLARKGGNHGR